MTPLEFVDPLVDLLLGVLYRLTHLVSGLVRLVGCGVLSPGWNVQLSPGAISTLTWTGPSGDWLGRLECRVEHSGPNGLAIYISSLDEHGCPKVAFISYRPGQLSSRSTMSPAQGTSEVA